MTLSSEQFHTLYDGAAQPVILVRDGAVAELNCHAQELFAVGTALRAYLPQDAALPEMLYARPAVLPVMAGSVSSASVPPPRCDCSRIEPPCACMIACTTGRLKPAPKRESSGTSGLA